MKTFLIFLLFPISIKAGELDLKFDPEMVRCQFVSSGSKTIVTHKFQIHQWEETLCQYVIMVNDNIILSSKAFNQDCRNFMRTQINKGSVCMTNKF